MPIESLVTIIPFLLALAWLLKESDYLRINLMPASETAPDAQVKPAFIPVVDFKPSVFEPLVMPATTGNINIICVRE